MPQEYPGYQNWVDFHVSSQFKMRYGRVLLFMNLERISGGLLLGYYHGTSLMGLRKSTRKQIGCAST